MNNIIILIGVISILFLIKIKIDSIKLNNKFNHIKTKLSGVEIANLILENNNIENIYVIKGERNYFDIFRKSIRLSENTFDDTSLLNLIEAASYSYYAIENNILIKIKCLFNQFITILSLISYFMIIAGLLTTFTLMLYGFMLLICIITFLLLLKPLQDNILENTLNVLKEEKIIKEKEELTELLKYVYIVNLLVPKTTF